MPGFVARAEPVSQAPFFFCFFFLFLPVTSEESANLHWLLFSLMNLGVLKAWFIYLFWWQIKHQAGCSSQSFLGWGCGAVIHWLNWIACCFMGFFPVKSFGTQKAGCCLKDEQRAAGLTKAGNIFKLMYTERPLKQEWCGHISIKTNQAKPFK